MSESLDFEENFRPSLKKSGFKHVLAPVAYFLFHSADNKCNVMRCAEIPIKYLIEITVGRIL